MVKRKIKYREGDVFLVPSRDGDYYLGQVIIDASTDNGSCFCYFFETKIKRDRLVVENINLSSESLVSATLVTPEMIQRGYWPIVANVPKLIDEAEAQFCEWKKLNFINVWVTGGGLISDMMDTYFGLLEESYWARLDMVYDLFLKPSNNNLSL
jgi:Immunity protein 26